MLDIKLLHTKECHIYHKAIDELEAALTEHKEDVEFKIILIDSNEKAAKYKFSGSPAIQINNEDIDPLAKKIKKYSITSCRPYFWQNKNFDYPPKEMIIDALKKTNK